MDHKFQLGYKLRDKVSGLEGIITSRVEYINGCVQYGIAGKVENGKLPDTYYVDQQQLEFVDNGIVVDKKETGGPSGIASGFGLSKQ